ncbi:MAG: hypothetical protein JW806_06495 [Sedimentisphaerales bacterium]|nr:hypothetical protein [Sedimentisphaerales bacterium]
MALMLVNRIDFSPSGCKTGSCSTEPNIVSCTVDPNTASDNTESKPNPYGLDVKGNVTLKHQIGVTIIMLIFAKLNLLVLPIIIVTDNSISKSFDCMWKIKLRKAKTLLTVFLVNTVVLPYLLRPLPNLYTSPPQISWLYIFGILFFVISTTLGFVVQVLALRFVSSEPIIENYMRPPDPAPVAYDPDYVPGNEDYIDY